MGERTNSDNVEDDAARAAGVTDGGDDNAMDDDARDGETSDEQAEEDNGGALDAAFNEDGANNDATHEMG